MDKIKIEVLFPEIANLYGDLENISYLTRSCPEVEVIKTGLADEPLFASEVPALVYMGTMSESAQELVIGRLSQYKDILKKRIDEGMLFLATGNALEVFGLRIENVKDASNKMVLGEAEMNRVIDALGFFPTVARRDMMHRFNSLYLGEFNADEDNPAAGVPGENGIILTDDRPSNKLTIVGYKSQFTHSYMEDGAKTVYEVFDPAFVSNRGPGLNPDTDREGIRVNNFIATYVIGPLLVLNPPFTKWLLGKMGVDAPKLAFEEDAMKAYEVRVAEYSDENTGFYY